MPGKRKPLTKLATAPATRFADLSDSLPLTTKEGFARFAAHPRPAQPEPCSPAFLTSLRS